MHACLAHYIKSVYFPHSVTKIGDCAFKYCSRLKRIRFRKDSQLKSIGLHSFAFTILEIVVLPMSLESIGVSAFKNCKFLRRAILPDNTCLKHHLCDSFDCHTNIRIEFTKKQE